MKKTIHHFVNVDVYCCQVLVSIGETDEILKKKLKKYGIDTDAESNMWKYSSDCSPAKAGMFSGNRTFIRMRTIPSSPFDYGVLAHEVFHATTFMMDIVGMGKLNLKINSGNDEAYAYLIGFLTKQIHQLISDAKKKQPTSKKKALI